MIDSALTDRQQNFIKFMKINDLSFMMVADKAGVPYSTLKSFATKPGQSMLGKNEQKLAAAFGITTEDIFVNPTELESREIETATPPLSKRVNDSVSIPEYDIKLSAGGGFIVDREVVKSKWSFGADYITGELRLNPASLSMVEITGDSMYPTLHSGDRVLVNHEDQNVFREGVFAVWNGYATVAKRVEFVAGSSPPRLVLISDNKSHNQYEVYAADINVVGRIVWFARRM